MEHQGSPLCLHLVQTSEAAKHHVANMMRLCKDLRLPVVHKVSPYYSMFY